MLHEAIRRDFKIIADMITNPQNLSSCYKALDRDFSNFITTLRFLGFGVAEYNSVQLTKLHFTPYSIFPGFGPETHRIWACLNNLG
jgi:hypothetical protein